METKKNKPIQIRVDEHEFRKITSKAASMNMGVGEYLRHISLEGLEASVVHDIIKNEIKQQLTMNHGLMVEMLRTHLKAMNESSNYLLKTLERLLLDPSGE